MSQARGGYQPSTRSAERRAFFDARRVVDDLVAKTDGIDGIGDRVTQVEDDVVAVNSRVDDAFVLANEVHSVFGQGWLPGLYIQWNNSTYQTNFAGDLTIVFPTLFQSFAPTILATIEPSASTALQYSSAIRYVDTSQARIRVWRDGAVVPNEFVKTHWVAFGFKS